MYKIYPKVKYIKYTKDEFTKKDKYSVFFTENLENVFTNLKSFIRVKKTRKVGDINFIYEKARSVQTYKLVIEKDKIDVYYNDASGAYYASQTLKQIFKFEKLETVEIWDEPKLLVRGFTLDISRNKVPSLKTIYKIIDLMAELKMNHFELYVEGFSYEYGFARKYLLEDGYITKEEYKLIEDYCFAREIDFVPNQNGFGHMGPWLATKEYKDLAICPDGAFYWGRHRSPVTLDPKDPRSIQLVSKMYEEMLPNRKSKYFNINFDEPMELGMGKTKELVEKEGLSNVYLDYLNLVLEEVKKYNKTPIMWGDVLIKDQEALKKLPKDIIFVDWGYDATYKFSETLKTLGTLNIKFGAAPGTTSWCSFTGRTQDFIENIKSACDNVYKYNGLGILLTDWGDAGHLQLLPSIVAPLVFAGFYSWSLQEGEMLNVTKYLNEEVFQDEKGNFAQILLGIGNYYQFENYYITNATLTFFGYMWADYALKQEKPLDYYYEKIKNSVIEDVKYKALVEYLKLYRKGLKNTKLKIKDKKLVLAEINQSIDLVLVTRLLMQSFNPKLDKNNKLKLLEKLFKNEKILEKQKELWLARNKKSNLAESIEMLEAVFKLGKLHYKALQGENYE